MRLKRFLRGFRVMWHACRTDYPCEGCEMGRWASLRAAVPWAWKYR